MEPLPSDWRAAFCDERFFGTFHSHGMTICCVFFRQPVLDVCTFHLSYLTPAPFFVASFVALQFSGIVRWAVSASLTKSNLTVWHELCA